MALALPAPTGRVCACGYPASCLIHRNFGGLSGVSPAAQAELGLSRTIRVESPLYPFAIPVSGECQEERACKTFRPAFRRNDDFPLSSVRHTSCEGAYSCIAVTRHHTARRRSVQQRKICVTRRACRWCMVQLPMAHHGDHREGLCQAAACGSQPPPRERGRVDGSDACETICACPFLYSKGLTYVKVNRVRILYTALCNVTAIC